MVFLNWSDLVTRWVQASMEERRAIWMGPSVAGCAVSWNNEIHVVSLPEIHGNSIIGVLGDVAGDSSLPTPVQIDLTTLVQNGYQVTSIQPRGFIGLRRQQPSLLQVGSPLGAAIGPVAANSRIGLIPVGFPLFANHGIVDGPIANAQVLDALTTYHSLLGEWGLMLRRQLTNGILSPNSVPVANAPIRPGTPWPALPPADSAPLTSNNGLDVTIRLLFPSNAVASASMVKAVKQVALPPFDHNSYATIKSHTQTALNTSLIVANFSALLIIARKHKAGTDLDFYAMTIVFLGLSIFFELGNAILALYLASININSAPGATAVADTQEHAHFLTKAALLFSFFSLVMNALTATLLGDMSTTNVTTSNFTAPAPLN
jgi:hypothetical protein